jgi:uncharacterized protein
MTPDVNVLVAAARDDHVHHSQALSWLKAAVTACSSGGTLRLMPMVLASFLRLVTNPKVFKLPTTTERAINYLDALLAIPGVELTSVGVEWPLFRQLCLDKQLIGNALPDAWLAAAVVQHGEHLATFDNDFRKLLGRGQVTVLKAV